MDKKLYAVYDMADNEQCLGLFTSSGIAKSFGITTSGLFHAIKRSSLVRKRYRIYPTKYNADDITTERFK